MSSHYFINFNFKLINFNSQIFYSQRLKPAFGRQRQCGLTLIELMIAMTLGILIITGTLSAYSLSNANYSSIYNNVQQFESGRQSLDVLRQDLKHAGFYGDFYTLGAGTVLPDPCAKDLTSLTAALEFPVQQLSVNGTSPVTCIPTSSIVDETKILVIRRAETDILETTPDLNGVYIQSTPTAIEVQEGKPASFRLGAINPDNSLLRVGTTADGVIPTLLKRANRDGAVSPDTSLRISADIRRYVVHIYFISTCSFPANDAEFCTGSSDDFGKPIPTLKRLELVAENGERIFRQASIVEGVENLQIDFGVDDTEANTIGAGVPTSYTNLPTIDEWTNVVSARIFVISRNLQEQQDFIDKKIYNMGIEGAVGPFGDHYKRRLYTSLVRINNLAGRREIPN